MAQVLGLLRAGVGLMLIALTLWCAFRVPLGRRTFAEHADRIGETPEARELVESTRGALSPMLEDATQRMLGEHIEAPTGPTTAPPPPANRIPRATPPTALPSR
jgi:hypothetical protein